jgi:hypothetical protein
MRRSGNNRRLNHDDQRESSRCELPKGHPWEAFDGLNLANTAINTRKVAKLIGSHNLQQGQLLAAQVDLQGVVAHELARSNQLAEEANQHAIALVNEQLRTNQLLRALLTNP